jgi:enoyl-CoA hydratase/carnithine racemase
MSDDVDSALSHARPVLRREQRGAVMILTLSRPEKLNALNQELLSDVVRALDGAELDPSVRAIVITGEGRAFSAGADIAEFQPHLRAGPAEAVVRFLRPGQRMTRRVEAFPKPIVAAVNGLAFGGGCELVEATHIALAATSASFSKAEINIGIIPTFGGTQRLPRNVGRKAATELILTGRRFDAVEAARLGLVNRVVADADLLPEAIGLAQQLAEQPPITVSAALAAIHRGVDASIDDGLAIEEAAFALVATTRDAQEGVAAFVEKRRPVFKGE